MVTLEIILQMLPILSLSIAIIYYSINVRNANKNQKIATESRQLQYLLELNRHISEAGSKNYIEIMSMEWNDFDDFIEKYGIANNPDNAGKRNRIWNTQHISGLMIRDGLLDVKTYMEYIGDAPIQVWMKYKDIIEEFRRQFEFPAYLVGLEILAEELDKLRIKEGYGAKKPYGPKNIGKIHFQ